MGAFAAIMLPVVVWMAFVAFRREELWQRYERATPWAVELIPVLFGVKTVLTYGVNSWGWVQWLNKIAYGAGFAGFGCMAIGLTITLLRRIRKHVRIKRGSADAAPEGDGVE